jgi:hypothetical protein
VSDDTYLMLVDGKVAEVDLGPVMRRHRKAHIDARAGLLDQAAALPADEAFSIEEVREMWQRSGLSDDDLDAAANVAFALWTVEQLRK